MASLDFKNQLKLVKPRVQSHAVWDNREIEDAAAQRPMVLVPFQRRSIRVTPSVGGVVECPGVDERPVHKILPRIVCILVCVEDVRDGKLAKRENKTVGRSRSVELIDRGLRLLDFIAEPKRLSDKHSLEPRIRIIGADFVSFPARKACDAKCLAEPETLIDLRIDPKFGALPETNARIERRIPSLASGF